MLNEEHTAAFRQEASRIFPMMEGEDLDVYCARARAANLKIGQRALLAAHLGQSFKRQMRERQIEKGEWIRTARLAFNPGTRSSCTVCGAYESLTHAHHVIPLSMQFDLALEEPLHDFDWVCPTHHHALHVIIESLIKTTQPRLEGMPPRELDQLDKLAMRFVNLWTRLPNWHSYKHR